MNNFRLRQSIGIVVHSEIVEFFKSNVRESIKIKISFPNIIDLLKMFDGKNSLHKIVENYSGIKIEQLEKLALFLNENHIIINQDCDYPENITDEKYRLINTLEDYCLSTSDVLNCINRLNSSKVMIVGVGAVGSNIATYLAHCDVGKIILVDHDYVDISNLHRQFFFETEINAKKNFTLGNRLRNISPNINIDIIDDVIDDGFFNRNYIPSDINLIINCADEPSVDYTSRIIAMFCMDNKIPHIVGGGYNLHQTLIGQTIIPFKSACFNCFNLFLNEKNFKELENVKKLHREKRKLGSFSPLSGIAASLASLDAIKVLTEKFEYLQQENRRVEFSLRSLYFNIQNVPRNKQCDWCGGSHV